MGYYLSTPEENEAVRDSLISGLNWLNEVPGADLAKGFLGVGLGAAGIWMGAKWLASDAKSLTNLFAASFPSTITDGLSSLCNRAYALIGGDSVGGSVENMAKATAKIAAGIMIPCAGLRLFQGL